MSHPIHPPAYKATEQEHRIAWLKWCLDRLIWDRIYPVKLYRDDGHFKNPEKAEQELARVLALLFDHHEGDTEDTEPYEKVWLPHSRFDQFKKNQEESLADFHAGDCTAIAAACSRCHAEQLYGVPSTVTWNGKSEGWRLYNEWRDSKTAEDD